MSYDATAEKFLEEAARGTIRIVPHDGDRRDEDAYREKEADQRLESHIPAGEPIHFLEVNVRDSSEFARDLRVHGRKRAEYRILWVNSAAVPNSVATILLDIRDRTGATPHVYFECNPVTNLLRFLFVGQGEVAPVTREVLRRAEPDVSRRPHLHVG